MPVRILGQSISNSRKQIRKFGLGGDAFQPLRHIGDDQIEKAARALGISNISTPEEASRVVNWREGMTPFEYDYQKTIDLANINKEIENMRNQSNKYIAEIQGRTSTEVARIGAGATQYTADRQKEATTYVADREKEAALGVENIRTQGALDLQDIVNAGLKDVETIRGKSARDVATIGGEFDVKSEEVKGKTARDVARIDRDKGIYGSLISAFQF
jgi:hypothetical protein